MTLLPLANARQGPTVAFLVVKVEFGIRIEFEFEFEIEFEIEFEFEFEFVFAFARWSSGSKR